MKEIERKFLVTSRRFEERALSHTRIVQGFLNTHPDRTVRVRIKGDTGILTVKGRSSEDGTSRFEWETEIPVAEAEQLLLLCEPGIIEKERHEVRAGDHIFEVDVFSGDNAGLIIAELELSSEDEKYKRPEWLGREVTGDVRYYNSELSKNPYINWK